MRDCKEVGSRALHNYLVALYCKPNLRSEQKLLNHFNDSASLPVRVRSNHSRGSLGASRLLESSLSFVM